MTQEIAITTLQNNLLENISIARTMPERNSRAEKATEKLKKAIWIYFILLIFEGALRKWVLPGLSTPLLIIRDPVAIWILITAWNKRLVKSNIFLTTTIIIGFASVFTAIFFGHGNFLVALFGARILLIHFPLIFIIGNVFERADVIKMGKAILLISVPMAILIGFQFYSPQSAWVNRGIGGDIEGGGFSGALGFFRPPATFSFISGTASFFSLAGCFVFYFWFDNKSINRVVLLLATVAILAAIPFSISRSLLFGVLMSLGSAILAIVRKPQYIGRMLFAGLAIFVMFSLFGESSVIQTAMGAFNNRFETATEQEGGFNGVVGGRFIGGMTGAVSEALNQPFWGYGIGMGTNVGAMFLSGSKTFLIAEGEWGRLIGEEGPMLGFGIILIRLLLCIKLSIAAYKKLLAGDFLPWMLLSFCMVNLLQGQWGQPTSLGFTIIITGLIVASFNKTE